MSFFVLELHFFIFFYFPPNSIKLLVVCNVSVKQTQPLQECTSPICGRAIITALYITHLWQGYHHCLACEKPWGELIIKRQGVCPHGCQELNWGQVEIGVCLIHRVLRSCACGVGSERETAKCVLTCLQFYYCHGFWRRKHRLAIWFHWYQRNCHNDMMNEGLWGWGWSALVVTSLRRTAPLAGESSGKV